MDIREIVWGDVDWIHLAMDGDQWQVSMNMVMTLWVPYSFGKILSN